MTKWSAKVHDADLSRPCSAAAMMAAVLSAKDHWRRFPPYSAYRPDESGSLISYRAIFAASQAGESVDWPPAAERKARNDRSPH